MILMMVMREEDRKEEQHFDGNDDPTETTLYNPDYKCLGLAMKKPLLF